MISQYEITMLYNAAFGYRGMPFPFVPLPGGIIKAKDYSVSEPEGVNKTTDFTLEKETPIANPAQYTDSLPFTRSLIGAPLYMPTGFSVGGSIVQLPDEPILSLSIKKNIVETTLAGNTRRGTVKEIINTEDWRIRIQGLCIDVSKQGYPEDQVEMIQQLFEYNKSLEIVNYMLGDVFGIKKVVLNSLNWLPMRGKPYSQAYEIELTSDEDFLLVIG